MQKLPIVLVGLVIILGAGAFLVSKKVAREPEPIFCTMEARLCPDGSYVGRSGPKCEFALCPNPSGNEGEATTARLNQKILNHGVYITVLSVVNDSRCPVDVTCIQADTVSIKTLLESEGGTQTVALFLNSPLTFAGKRIVLIAVTPAPYSKKTITESEYRFEFSVTEGVSVADGMLEGTMTIGPICPVERIDNPCKPTPEMFALRKVAVYKSDKKTMVTTLTPGGDGTFSMPLAVGIYYIDIASKQSGPGGVTGLPTTVTIKSGATIHLDISIDTGIR